MDVFPERRANVPEENVTLRAPDPSVTVADPMFTGNGFELSIAPLELAS